MMMLEFSVFPVGAGESLSGAVAEAVSMVRRSGLAFELTDMGTIVEGSPAECLRLVESCIEKLAEKHERISCSVKIDYRKSAEGRLGKKKKSVERELEKQKRRGGGDA